MAANYKLMLNHVFKWEGGEVNDPDDSGGHTNKGITRDTFNRLAVDVLGKQPTLHNFRYMTRKDAELIFRHIWMKATWNNRVESQAIAETMTQWLWGSGPNGIKLFQRMLNKHYLGTYFDTKLKVDGASGKNTVTAANAVPEAELFKKCVETRSEYFKYLGRKYPEKQKFVKGWLNRLRDFSKRHADLIDKTGKGIAAAFFLVS